jgi:hypothetical protein
MIKFTALLTLFLISSSTYIFGDGTFIYNRKHIPAPELPQVQNIIRPVIVLVLIILPQSQS